MFDTFMEYSKLQTKQLYDIAHSLVLADQNKEAYRHNQTPIPINGTSLEGVFGNRKLGDWEQLEIAYPTWEQFKGDESAQKILATLSF
jgi:hypothetical protein